MNILLINHYAGSPALRHGVPPVLPGARVGARGAPRADRGRRFSHVRARQPAWPGDEAHRRHRLSLAADAAPTAATGWAACATSAAFLRAVWAEAPRLRREFRPDVVIASSTYPMDIWVARGASRALRRRQAGVRGARPVAAVADRAVGHVALAPVHRCCARRPRTRPTATPTWWCRCCPRCTRTWPRTGWTWRKLHVVPNGIAPDEWQAAPQPLRADVRSALDAARAAGRTVVGYAGSMGLPNALDTLARRRRAAARRAAAASCWSATATSRRGWRGASPPRAGQRDAAAAGAQGADPGAAGGDRHRLHRLAARADLPLRHRAEQADGLHDGRLRRCCIRSMPATTRWPKPAAA